MKKSSHMIIRDEACLVVVDVQEKLFPYVENREEIKKKIIKLIKTSKLFSIPILVSEHYPKGLGRTIDEILKEIETVPKIEKVTFSCGGSEDFNEKLSSIGKKKIILCGIETHICVAQTVFDMLENGYKIFVAADAVSSRKSLDHNLGVERMREAGAVITTTEAVMYELMEEAANPLFKEFLKLVKD